MNRFTLAIVLFVGIIIGLVVLVAVPGPKSAQAPTNPIATTTNPLPATTTAQQATLPDLVVVSSPLIGATVHSPLTITGKARGSWYFEASAPVELRDQTGTVIAQGHITAQGDWMTANFVPFSATLTFTKPAVGTTGTLVLKNDNPSGDPSRQKELDIPVSFK
jgi:hypothetical protein